MYFYISKTTRLHPQLPVMMRKLMYKTLKEKINAGKNSEFDNYEENIEEKNKTDAISIQDFEHLDFQIEDKLAFFCRERLNHVTERTMTVVLMEMRLIDKERKMILPQDVINQLIRTYRIPLTPCIEHLHRKFADKRMMGMTNYEQMMEYLEMRRKERQMVGPDEVRDWGSLANTEEGNKYI